MCARSVPRWSEQGAPTRLWRRQPRGRHGQCGHVSAAERVQGRDAEGKRRRPPQHRSCAGRTAARQRPPRVGEPHRPRVRQGSGRCRGPDGRGRSRSAPASFTSPTRSTRFVSRASTATPWPMTRRSPSSAPARRPVLPEVRPRARDGAVRRGRRAAAARSLSRPTLQVVQRALVRFTQVFAKQSKRSILFAYPCRGNAPTARSPASIPPSSPPSRRRSGGGTRTRRSSSSCARARNASASRRR